MEKQREEVRGAAEKQRAYDLDSRKKVEAVLVKNKPPCDWNISELTAILYVI